MRKHLLIFLCVALLLSACSQPERTEQTAEQETPKLLSKEKLEDFGGPYNGTLWNCTYSFRGKTHTSKHVGFSVNGANYYGYLWDDRLSPSLDWIKNNTPENSRFICWWDYAGMLMGYAGRYAVAYAPSDEILYTVGHWSESEPTIPHEIIDDVSKALTADNPDYAVKIARKYDAEYFYIPKRSIYLLHVILQTSGKDPESYVEWKENNLEIKDKAKELVMVKMINGENIEGFAKVYEDGYCAIYRLYDAKAKLSINSENFSKLSSDAQDFILNTEWIKDGVDEDDIRYVDSIPISFNPADKSADTDKGGLEDVWEVMYRGDVTDSSDDLQIQAENYIPGKGILTFPFREEDIQKVKILSYFDLDPGPGIRNWMGNSFCTDPNHFAIDFGVPEGTPIVAASPGIVVKTGVFPEGSICPGAVYLQIDYMGYRTTYGHLSKILVKEGEKVERGQVIALSGNTGECSARPHLHFAFYKKIKNGFIDLDPFRDITNSSSKAYWINDNDPIVLSKDGKWQPLSKIVNITTSCD